MVSGEGILLLSSPTLKPGAKNFRKKVKIADWPNREIWWPSGRKKKPRAGHIRGSRATEEVESRRYVRHMAGRHAAPCPSEKLSDERLPPPPRDQHLRDHRAKRIFGRGGGAGLHGRGASRRREGRAKERRRQGERRQCRRARGAAEHLRAEVERLKKRARPRECCQPAPDHVREQEGKHNVSALHGRLVLGRVPLRRTCHLVDDKSAHLDRARAHQVAVHLHGPEC